MTRISPWLATLGVSLTFLASPLLARPPVPVSPGSPVGGVVGTACPSFSWTVGERGGPYDLVVYPVTTAGELGAEPALAARLPAGAQSWTPSAERCLDEGSRYAWTLREIDSSGESHWSEPVLFQISAGPSQDEVELALATLRRYLAERQIDGGSPDPSATAPERTPAPPDKRLRDSAATTEASIEVKSAAVDSPPIESAAGLALASAPVLASPSLTVSSDIALAAASNVFKDGSVFLWDDTSGNTALGRDALTSATGTATDNTAVGRNALKNTTAGAGGDEGSNNTATGVLALYFNSTGWRNTAVGARSLFSNTTGYANTAIGELALLANTGGSFQTALGSRALQGSTAYGAGNGDGNTATGALALYNTTAGSYNTAVGTQALFKNTEGNRNVAIGSTAGYWVTGAGRDDNIFISNTGVQNDSKKIRIGTQGTQNGTFIAGIHGVTTGEEAVSVLIDNTGHLGTMLSKRAVKQDIQEIGELSERLLALRPVAFRYKVHAAADPQTPLQFGLIAEEVAEVFPGLVVFDEDGRPETVKYHLLATLLLNELQRGAADNEVQRSEIQRLRRENELRDARLEALEQGDDASRDRPPWWRRLGRGSGEVP